MSESCRACGQIGPTRPTAYGLVCIHARSCLSRIYAQILERRARE